MLRLTRLLPLSFLLLAGCIGPDIYTQRAIISGGDEVLIPYTAKGPIFVHEEGFQVNEAIFSFNPEQKSIGFRFDFTVDDGRAPRRVIVEDVTSSKPVLLVDDGEPKLNDKKRWHCDTPFILVEDPRLKWVYTVDNAMHVYRFTITTADGKTVKLLQGMMVPAFIKFGIRRVMGEKY